MKKRYLKILFLEIFLISSLFSFGQWYIKYEDPNGPVLNKIKFIDNEHGLAVGSNGIILLTNDCGENWSVFTFFPGDFTDLIFVNDSIAYLNMSGYLYRFNIYTNEFGFLTFIPNGLMYHNIILLNDSEGYLAGDDGIIYFDTSGYYYPVWSFIANGYDGGEIYSMDRANDSILYASGYSLYQWKILQIVLKSIDNGANWFIVQNNDSIPSGDIKAISEDSLFIGGGHIYKSTDSGNTWQKTIMDSIYYYPSIVALFFTDSNIGYAVGGFDHIKGFDYREIYGSTNGGETWTNQLFEDEEPLYSLFFINDSVGFACGGDCSILKTVNGGGFFTGIKENQYHHAGIEIYPNPSCREINIRFKSNENKPIEIQFINMSGKLVKSLQLIQNRKSTARINVNDLLPGVYIVKVVSNNTYFTEKLIIQ